MIHRPLVLLFALASPLCAALTITNPTCEFAADPLGVDIATPRLSWQVASEERGAKQTAYQLLVASSPELLAAGQGDLWDSGRIESTNTVLVPYAGKPLTTSQQVFWSVRSWNERDEPSEWSAPATWTMGVLKPEDWKARWIVAPWQTESILMRTEFPARVAVKRAVVHVCGLGQFELFLNGRKVGDNLIAPGWSKYNRTCLYETHDVTALLSPGENALGIALGDGMHHTERRHRFSKFQGTFGPQRAIVQLEIEYADGERQLVTSDDLWRCTPGPVTFSDIYGGEDFDARKNPRGWKSAGFDDSAWPNAVILVGSSDGLRGLCSSAPPIRAIEEISPVARKQFGERQEVIDLGQNASFMPRITVTGPAGSTVRLTHAEVVREDGAIDRGTCGGNRGPAYWQYTKATDQPETWFPQFFYAGCRYLQLDKLPADNSPVLPQVTKLTGVVVHSAAKPAGEFACSNELLNRIRTLVRWAQRSNLVSVLTDCPHREKLGWLEQYHLNGPGVRYEFAADRIFIKGMRDMADSQLDTGLVPNIAPEYVVFDGTFRAAAEWGSAVILVPWQHYESTGDASLLRDYYPVMQRYLDYLTSRATNHYLEEGLGDWYDIGPEKPGFSQLTPPRITATAFYFHAAEHLAKIAQLLGNPEDAQRYQKLAADIRAAWVQEFRHPDGSYATKSQCAHAMALEFGLAEPQDRPKTLAALVSDIRERDHSTTAGDVGFRYELEALAHGGHSDVIYKMINQDSRPGYGYQLKSGATALTEAWDANHTSSHNHFMLGHITEWFYKHLAGIAPDPASPGYANIIIAPQPVGDLKWVEATHHTIRGPVHVRWERDGEALTLDVTVPANTTATVKLPNEKGANVTEAGRAINQAPGVKVLPAEGDRAVLQIESGKYRFLVGG